MFDVQLRNMENEVSVGFQAFLLRKSLFALKLNSSNRDK